MYVIFINFVEFVFINVCIFFVGNFFFFWCFLDKKILGNNWCLYVKVMDLYYYIWFECVLSYGVDLVDKMFFGL